MLRLAVRALPAALLAAAVSAWAPAQASTASREHERLTQVSQPLAEANAALQAGEADKALALLNSLPPSGVSLAEASNLECRVRLTLEQWNSALTECQQAVGLDGENSGYHL